MFRHNLVFVDASKYIEQQVGTIYTKEKISELLGGSEIFVYLCRRSRKGLLRQKKRYAPNLRVKT